MPLMVGKALAAKPGLYSFCVFGFVHSFRVFFALPGCRASGVITLEIWLYLLL